MKEGWEYKRFDEVFDLQMGKTPDRKNPHFFEGNNVWVSIRDMDGKEIIDSNEHISDEAIVASKIRIVKKGTVLMSFKLTVGKCAIAARDLYTNEAIMAFNQKEGYDVNPDFLYFYLLAYHWNGANKAVMGMTLNKATISQNRIGIPPLTEQERIVSELDLLTSIINKQKAQLKELDSLAQSIFYDMFGDPIENPNRWEIGCFNDICEVTSSKRVYQSEWQSSGIPFYRISDFTFLVDNAEITPELFISQEKYNELKNNNQVPKSGDILVSTRGTLGKCYIIKKGDHFYFQDGMITWLKNIDRNILNKILAN